jgi:hypothetical protein
VRTSLSILCGSLALSACATLVPRMVTGTELIGHSVQMVTARGQTSILHFEESGAVRATYTGGQTSGRWFMRNNQLCFLWGSAPQECWPYSVPLQRGRTRSITSDRGNVVQVTLN